MDLSELIKPFRVKPDSKISLKKDFDPRFTYEFVDKGEAREKLEDGIVRLSENQEKLYAQSTYALLIIFQAMDAAGKDSTIKHVMSGVNPQGCRVSSFKTPSNEELLHDYLWRCEKRLPERGQIGIFNRSYYEEVLVARVHPEILELQKLPDGLKGKKIWQRRFEQINAFEKHLVENGTIILKFFLNVSKAEQKKRFLARIEDASKNWKFSASDIKERAHWDEYQEAYEDVFNNTSTEWAPWYVIPADKKWFTRLAVAAVIIKTLEDLSLQFPEVSEDQKQALLVAQKELLAED